ncbi:unnamed protein product [Soboliphyme baturini]|uniref:DUF1902 domain-containing protein n=1 Tax=Soboliphyme baturini TaxID=241478 RepID=A0A183J7C7_9BILA|nr:unnamed protein product [Soboliphyme baturini]
MDDFIQKNFKVISEESKEFTSLPYIEIEVLQRSRSPLDTEAIISETMLGEKVLHWIRQQVVELPEHIEFRMELLTERV